MLDVLQYPKTVACLLLVLQLVLWKAWERWRRSNFPLPPGPSGYPIFGNLFDIPTEHPEYGYSRLLVRYGDMVYLESFGTRILVLGSLKRTTDVLEKRSSIYSDRPQSPILTQMEFDEYLSLMQYGSRWRRQRKMFHQHFNLTAVSTYHPIFLEERTSYIRDLLEDPAAFWERTRTYFSRNILRSTYGIQPKGNDDPFIKNPQLVGDGFSIAGKPGTFMVDFLPFLKYVPDWVPGTGWKKFARYYSDASMRTRILPFEHVREQQRQGSATHCALLSLLHNLPGEDDPSFEDEVLCVRDAAAIAYIGGADTSLGITLATFNLLATHIDIQKRVQTEIDQVVGLGKVPGIAHAASEDDVYDGYFIPKGTIIIGNSWHILHDPEIYPDPFTFNPDRFIKDGKLSSDILDPYSAAFGFGRRICPGRHFNHDTIFILISSVLACFELSPPKDESGTVIPLKWELEEGMLMYVAPSSTSQAVPMRVYLPKPLKVLRLARS